MPKAFSSFAAYEKSYRSFLRELGEASPCLRSHFVLAGSAPASIQYMQHTFSGDADFYTKAGLSEEHVFEARKELRKALGDRFKEDSYEPEYGYLQGALECKDGHLFEVDLKCSEQDQDPESFSPKGQIEGFDCGGLGSYINAKVHGCLVGRNEPKDVYHLAVASKISPRIQKYVSEEVKKISQDDMDREALTDNLEYAKEVFQNPDPQMAELMADRPGKQSVSRDRALEFASGLFREIHPPRVQRPKAAEVSV